VCDSPADQEVEAKEVESGHLSAVPNHIHPQNRLRATLSGYILEPLCRTSAGESAASWNKGVG